MWYSQFLVKTWNRFWTEKSPEWRNCITSLTCKRLILRFSEYLPSLTLRKINKTLNSTKDWTAWKNLWRMLQFSRSWKTMNFTIWWGFSERWMKHRLLITKRTGNRTNLQFLFTRERKSSKIYFRWSWTTRHRFQTIKKSSWLNSSDATFPKLLRKIKIISFPSINGAPTTTLMSRMRRRTMKISPNLSEDSTKLKNVEALISSFQFSRKTWPIESNCSTKPCCLASFTYTTEINAVRIPFWTLSLQILIISCLSALKISYHLLEISWSKWGKWKIMKK